MEQLEQQTVDVAPISQQYHNELAKSVKRGMYKYNPSALEYVFRTEETPIEEFAEAMHARDELESFRKIVTRCGLGYETQTKWMEVLEQCVEQTEEAKQTIELAKSLVEK